MAMSKIRLTAWILAVFATFASVQSWDDVLIWNVTSKVWSPQTFIFQEDSFEEFSDCLCNLTTASCEVRRVFGKWVYQDTLRRDEIASNKYSNRYICEMRYFHYYYYLFCRRMQYSENRCSNTSHCWTLNVGELEEPKNCGFEFVQIIWSQDQQVEEEYRSATVVDMNTSCQAGCSIIKIDNRTDAAIGDGDKGDVAGVITGAVVGFIVVVAILVVLGVLYWKRRRKALTGKRTSTNLNELSMTTYSVAFQDAKEKKPEQNLSNTSSSGYATIDPARETISNGAASFSNEEDPGYYNPDAFEGNHQPDNVNNGSSTIEQHGTDYYSLDNGHNGSTSSTGVDVNSTLNIVVGTHISPNDYAAIDENSCTTDNTYNVIDDNTNKDIVENGPTQNDNQRTTDTTQYEYVNPAMTGVGMEYSKLHDPVRHFKDPYNVVSPSDDEIREDGNITPSASADSAPITYSLAHPFLKESINHTQPVEVIDIDPPLQQPMRDEEPQGSSELTNRKAEEFSDRKHLHLKDDLSDPSLQRGQ